MLQFRKLTKNPELYTAKKLAGSAYLGSQQYFQLVTNSAAPTEIIRHLLMRFCFPKPPPHRFLSVPQNLLSLCNPTNIHLP